MPTIYALWPHSSALWHQDFLSVWLGLSLLSYPPLHKPHHLLSLSISLFWVHIDDDEDREITDHESKAYTQKLKTQKANGERWSSPPPLLSLPLCGLLNLHLSLCVSLPSFNIYRYRTKAQRFCFCFLLDSRSWQIYIRELRLSAMVEDSIHVPCTVNPPSVQFTCPVIGTNTITNKKKRRPAGTPGAYVYKYI